MTASRSMAVLLAAFFLGTAISAQADTTTILTTAPSAENAIQTSDGRLFVSASDGLYQVNASTKTKTKVPVALSATSAASTSTNCYFTGLAQYQNYLYAACTPDVESNFALRHLLVMDLNQSPQMRSFHSVSDIGFFNGISLDANGNIYAANFGSLATPSAGRIIKLTMSSRTTVASKVNWLYSTGRINGIRVNGNTVYYVEDNVYFAGYNYFKKVGITSIGTAGTPQTIYRSTNYIDDFILVTDGAVLATAAMSPFAPSNGEVVHISETGAVLHSAKFPGWQPTAVAFMKTPTWGSLLVTELAQGNVFILGQSWGLNPR